MTADELEDLFHSCSQFRTQHSITSVVWASDPSCFQHSIPSRRHRLFEALQTRNWTNNPVSAPFRWNTSGGVTYGQFGGSGYDPISPKFHDDDLLQHDELDGVLSALGASGLTWSCNARSEHITPDLAGRMYAAGCRRVFLGVESLNQQTLDYFRKATTVADNQRAVHWLDEAGIGVISGFIIGAPHDTLETILADLDRMLELPIYFLSTAILTPDIGTVEFQRARKTVPKLGTLTEGSRMNMRPRPDLFGAEAPFGLPTVCAAVDKPGLNELYRLIGCSFFLRDSARARIARYTLPGREEEIALWYDWIRDQAYSLSQQAREPSVRDRAQSLLSEAVYAGSAGAC